MLMQRSAIKVFLISIISVVVITGYGLFQLSLTLKQNKALKTQLDAISRHREQLQSQLRKVKDIISPLEKENISLKQSLEEEARGQTGLKKQATQAQAEAQSFKEKLIKAKTRLKELNKEFNLIKDEKASLEKQNLKINNSLKNTTENLTLTKDRLKLFKQKLSRIKKEDIVPLRREIAQLTKSLKIKDKDSDNLEEQLKDITKKYTTVSSANKSLEEKIEQLKKEGMSVKVKLYIADEQLSEQSGLISSLKNELNSVKNLLDEREKQRQTLESKLTQANLTKTDLQETLREHKQHLKEINAQYNDQKLKIIQLADILAQKELGLDNRNKEVLVLEGQISNLQSRLQILEMESTAAKEHQAKLIGYLDELTDLNVTLQGRLNELSQFIGEQGSDKEKAEKLKHKVEVILESIQLEEEQEGQQD